MFWQYLDEEAKRAEEEGKGFILQGDLNAWLGKKYILNDPRPQNQNGKFMEDFLETNDLTVVNGLDLCQGLFTQIRKTEKSVLDFFVVCKRVLTFVQKMNIDEQRTDIPTNYTQVRRGGKAVDSDHMLLEMHLDLKVIPTKPTRTILYNFKSEQGRKIFKELTTITSDFTNCFESRQPLQFQCEEWKNLLQSYCKKSFQKIRVRIRRNVTSSVDLLIEKRNKLKQKLSEDNLDIEKDNTLKKIEEEIAEVLAEEGRKKAYQFKKHSAENGSVSVGDMWILKKRLWPKNKETIQSGKLNHQGKLVTCPKELKALFSKEYDERLRVRPEHPNMKTIFEAKEIAFKSKCWKQASIKVQIGI